MSLKTKSPQESEVIMHEIVMPGDTNFHGTIFGGKVMSWIDIAGAMCAMKHCENPVVTVHIDDIDFISSINIGELVSIKASINYVGNTSMVVGVRVDKENPMTGEKKKTTKAYLTFVSINKEGKSVPVHKLQPQTDDEKRRYKNAEERAKSKKELNKRLK